MIYESLTLELFILVLALHSHCGVQPFGGVQKKLEAVHWRCSVEKIFLEISQNSQENTCGRVSFLIKLQTLLLQLY